MKNVFVSYSHRDMDFAEYLVFCSQTPPSGYELLDRAGVAGNTAGNLLPFYCKLAASDAATAP